MNRISFFRHFKFLVMAVIFAGTSVYAGAQENPVSVINIEAAEKSEYKKDAVTKEDCIVLSGGVVVSVSRGNDKTTIHADYVNYNRASEMLYASGNVSLEQTGGSAGGETITADSLLFNTSSLEGIFDNGRAVQTSSDAINLPSGSTLIVASEIFGRDSGGTIAFKGGELTFCDDDNPHWKIRASRIWLLPGGEFAFFNALLFVGRVPLLYFPAFYYPKDELIFNPTIGYKNREGYFINTTTYLYGRKPADASSTSSSSSSSDDDKIDFFSFMKSSSMKKQVREGLVLHNLDEDFTGDTTNHVKVMADYYSNLGAMVGTDVVLHPPKYISEFSANVELGFSNTIFKNDNVFMPFNRKGDLVSDGANFMSFETPFRYQTNFKLGISSPFNLSLSMPVYSDPYFDYDFNKRAETMDWIDFLMSSSDSDDDDDNITTVSSFSWALNGSYSFKLPQFIQPYISTLSLSGISSSIVYSSKATDSASLAQRDEYKADSSWATYTPERNFYYPSQITPFKASARIAGTLFQYPFPSKTVSASANIPSGILPPEELDTSEKEKPAEIDSDNPEESEIESEPEEKFALDETNLPLLTGVSPSTRTPGGVKYKLGYSISPDYSSQFAYSAAHLKSPEDFDWNELQSTYYQFKSPATVTSDFGYKDSFLSLSQNFTFNPVFQKHPFLSSNIEKGGYTETQANSIKKTDYNAKKLDLTDVNAFSIRPFYYTEHFASTSLTWNTTLKMIRTKYISEDVENPEWEYLTTDVKDDESLTVHNMNLVLGANEGSDFSQSLSLTTTLPPQVDEYSGVLSLKFPYTNFSLGTGIKQKSKDDKTWVKQDLSQSLSLSLFSGKLSVSESYVYDLEEEEHDSFRFSLSGYGVQLSYTMSYINGYNFDIDNGWKSDTEKKFQPYTASLAYSSGTKQFKYWANRISFAPSLSTSIVYDCLRPTNSYFKFIPAITFKVNNFLDITFSSESRNDVIYRYIQNYTGQNIQLAGETNVFKDLMNSFRFDDETFRKNSGFKLKNLSVKVTHDLDDWDLNCDFSIKPRLITDAKVKYYDFSPYFSISVSWRPMASMKTEIVDEYGEWKLNP